MKRRKDKVTLALYAYVAGIFFDCPVCGKPSWFRALGHGPQRHLTFCPRRAR